jgi:peptidoglycan endopeptidase LytF
MKLSASLTAFLFLATALVLFGCGGPKSNSYSRQNPAKIPTATLPANLPDPLIVQGLPTSRPVTPAGDTYTVQSGDTLSSIAEQLGTTVDELTSLNNLESSDLYVGQVLQVPKKSVSAATPTPRASSATPTRQATSQSTPSSRVTPGSGQNEYTVQSGDTAADIAANFGITLDELAAANNMTVDDLRSLSIGDVLIIPAGGSQSETPTSESEEATPTPQ